MRRTIAAAISMALTMLVPLSISAADPELTWSQWNAELFDKARSQNRLILLDLEAVWCHWCHVMERTTYKDPRIVRLLQSHFLTVRVDQDANPALASRYGDWGWPATILFAADGTELAKLQGYISPDRMASLLEAFIKDPTPGPSARVMERVEPARSTAISESDRKRLVAALRDGFDQKNGGWGQIHRFIDHDILAWALKSARIGDPFAEKMARKTLDGALKLIDRTWGGIYQYSDALDWSSPHFEKIMSGQTTALKHYAKAYALWKDDAYRAAANDIHRYLTSRLLSPDGVFFTSQDADVDANLSGKAFYGLDDRSRVALGRQPKIDHAIYARENGWAISALISYAASTEDDGPLATAEKAARWIVNNRGLDNGGFRHGENDRGGPFLGDTLAMGEAALNLFAATGKREWLQVAEDAARFIDVRFRSANGGFATSAVTKSDYGIFVDPVIDYAEQVNVARYANLLNHYTGNNGYRKQARHAVRYLTSQSIIDRPRPHAGLLLAVDELASQPTHITVVGHKGDLQARALHRAAWNFPSQYKRIDWWDKREGPLPNPDVTYPELDKPAAFACTDRICSSPVFDPQALAKTVNAMMAATRGG